jgi:predicted lysophospholipase L1 biosynthesis ABC-type transport system permease subunit
LNQFDSRQPQPSRALSSSVAERVREFGIRQALGADRMSILRLVLEQGLATTFAGMAAGALGSLILGRYLQSLLFGVTAHDPTILAASCAVLLLAAHPLRGLSKPVGGDQCRQQDSDVADRVA